MAFFSLKEHLLLSFRLVNEFSAPKGGTTALDQTAGSAARHRGQFLAAPQMPPCLGCPGRPALSHHVSSVPLPTREAMSRSGPQPQGRRQVPGSRGFGVSRGASARCVVLGWGAQAAPQCPDPIRGRTARVRSACDPSATPGARRACTESEEGRRQR